MITVSEKIPFFESYSEILGYSPRNSLFFDIETTGFSPASSAVFLIGVLFCHGSDWFLTQYLAESPAEEELVLKAFLDVSGNFSTLIHFNGSTFDLPYLIHKAESFRLPHELEEKQSLDLYKKYRSLKNFLGLPRMNQTSLEAFLGWQRRDRLTGKHMVALYQKYIAAGEEGLRQLLLLHNHDDMIGMTHLLKLSTYLLPLEGQTGEILSVNFPSRRLLEVSFRLTYPVPTPISFCQNYSLTLREDQGILAVPVFEGVLYHFFPDYRNYYYLPLEDQAIHKSVAAYVDKTYRQPAKASNCYIKKSGLFLPQPEELFTPAFKCSLDSSELYFAYSDDFPASQEHLHQYLSALLTALR